jgi:hypothetical protein
VNHTNQEAIMTTQAVATVLGGFWPANGVNSLATISGEDGERKIIQKMFGTRGHLAMRAVATALLGVAPGSNATKTITRVAPAVELGGVRPIETQTLVNRNTTAADVTEITQDYLTYTTRTSFGASPPANLDRNPLGTR